jgi:hypothetical protein
MLTGISDTNKVRMINGFPASLRQEVEEAINVLPISENKKYWQQTESRMISYWNEYYRRPAYPKYLPPKYATRKEYIGQQLVDKLKKRTHNKSIA